MQGPPCSDWVVIMYSRLQNAQCLHDLKVSAPVFPSKVFRSETRPVLQTMLHEQSSLRYWSSSTDDTAWAVFAQRLVQFHRRYCLSSLRSEMMAVPRTVLITSTDCGPVPRTVLSTSTDCGPVPETVLSTWTHCGPVSRTILSSKAWLSRVLWAVGCDNVVVR